MKLLITLFGLVACFGQTVPDVPDRLPPHISISPDDKAMFNALSDEWPTLMHIHDRVLHGFPQFGPDYAKAATSYSAAMKAYIVWDRQTELGQTPAVKPVKDSISAVAKQIHDIRDRLAAAINAKK